MAELKVEPKRGMGWIWVVVVLVVLAIVAWFFFAGDTVTTTTSIGTLAASPGQAAALI
jgi:hypothetical protein